MGNWSVLNLNSRAWTRTDQITKTSFSSTGIFCWATFTINRRGPAFSVSLTQYRPLKIDRATQEAILPPVEKHIRVCGLGLRQHSSCWPVTPWQSSFLHSDQDHHHSGNLHNSSLLSSSLQSVFIFFHSIPSGMIKGKVHQLFLPLHLKMLNRTPNYWPHNGHINNHFQELVRALPVGKIFQFKVIIILLSLIKNGINLKLFLI